MRVETPTIAVPLFSLATLGIASLLVTLRGHVNPEVIALVLAATVALSARIGGRWAGVFSAVMAALSFDYFHTRPYESLKISDGNDIVSTVLLLVVGLIVGGLSARASADRQAARALQGQGAVLRRVLKIAGDGDANEVELAVRGELQALLELQECRFVHGTSDRTALGPSGELREKNLTYHDEGFELPLPEFTIAVEGFGQHFGELVCTPTPHVGIDVTNRRTAVALAEVLGLVLGAPRAAHR